jgi:hypothetical protein
MDKKTYSTSWIWPHDNGVNGAVLNLEKGLVEWFDGPGCACGDSSQIQSFEDFLRHGPRYGTPPDDVLEEMRSTLESLRQQATERLD